MVNGRRRNSMKRKIYLGLAALIAGFLFTACADKLIPEKIEKENLVPETEKTMVFQASIEQPVAATKTSLSADGENVVWTEGDKIRIFNHSHQDGVVFTLKAGDGGKVSGSFEGAYIGSGPYYAIYPASLTEGLMMPFTETPLAINAEVEADQTYVSNSFSNGANVAVAASDEDTKFSFKNVFGAVAFTLKGDATITKVNVYTRGSDALNGSLQILNIDTDAPAGTVSGDPLEENLYKSLSCGSGVALNSDPGVTFYITVPVGAFANGFFVEFIDNAGNSMIKSAKASASNVIARSTITAMPAFDYSPQYSAAFLQEADDFAAYSAVTSGSSLKACTYTQATSQNAFLNTTGDPGSRSIRFQDWTAGYALSMNFAQYDLPLNAKPNVAIEALGSTGSITSVSTAREMKVVKRIGSRAWVVDNTDKNGYVVRLTD